MGHKIVDHNSNILNNVWNTEPKPKASWNCRKLNKVNCPLPDDCNQNGLVYKAMVETTNGRTESYVGLAKNFKKRWP